MVMQLSNSPDHSNIQDCVNWIDQHINATIPSEDEATTDTTKARLRQLIQQHMTHTCSDAVNGCLKNGSCKRGYGDRQVTAESTFDYRGYPDYRRPTPECLRVVPYHPPILLDWDGHINCEFAAGTQFCFGSNSLHLHLSNIHGALPLQVYLQRQQESHS